MAISDFVKRKLAMAFYRFDRNKDGVVDEADFTTLGAAVAALQGVEEGTEQHRKIVAAHQTWWAAYFKGGDADGDGKVTLEEYFAHVGAWVGADAEAMAHAIAGNELVFDAIDVNGDGALSPGEFSAYLQAYGLTDADARAAFSHLDLDGEGTMSRAEFAKNISAYYISEARGPSEWFFGGH
ncbi:EF-hand domain-containing protein [Chondromyces apiculatus]|uniref:Putative calcium binding protein n=1 Tax=Chondromyces apiculatus DSM 436 TaxID=1192034 RepID=A0A017T6R0_9BACT|nr:EF-hand domain-containing protein [Chondromyces apiculatus]EYF04266.1 putative calcium binding protein [Chondromyces apiculatus DSM 436]